MIKNVSTFSDPTQSMIRYLDWDTRFFEIKIGRVDVDLFDEKVFYNVIDQKKKTGFDLVYLFAENLSETGRAILEQKCIMPVDIKITFQKVSLVPANINSVFIEEYRGDLSVKLEELAIESGHMSRFKKDGRLNGFFSDMYRTWIEKSISGELADTVLVSKHEGEITGFITIGKKNNSGVIGLIAVDDQSRGKGIGRWLLAAAENWCISRSCSDLIVATQSENTAACNLYLRNGYKKLSEQYIFHI